MPSTIETRRSENDSTFSGPKLENVNINCVAISYSDPLHGKLSVSCDQIPGRNVITSIPSSWPKPFLENCKVPWIAQKLTQYGLLSSDLLHGTVHHKTKFQADS